MAGGWIGTRAACEQLGITLRTLYQLIDEGRIPAYKIGRVIRLRTDDIDRFGGQDGNGPAGVREPRKPTPPASSPGRATPPPHTSNE